MENLIRFIEEELVELDRDLNEAFIEKSHSKQAEQDFIYITGQITAYRNMLINLRIGEYK